MTTHNGGAHPKSKLTLWLTTFPTFALLTLILVIYTGEMVHGQMLKLGELMFSDTTQGVQYFLLRADPVPPTCKADVNIEEEVQKRVQAQSSHPAEAGSIDALFESEKLSPEVERASLVAAQRACQEKHEAFQHLKDHITPALKAYRTLEGSFFTLFQFGADNRALILIALLAVTATYTGLGFHHICLRPPRHRKDHILQSASQVVSYAMLTYSCVRYYDISIQSGIAIDDWRTYYAWIGLFGLLCLASAWRLVFPPKPLAEGPGSWIRALECVPLIATMGIVSSLYFFINNHPSGPAIYVNKMLDILSLPLALSLHIWAGMMFKQSRLVELFMNVLRPWKLSPEMLTYVILLAAGLPTAYAGVSSVFVIAAGAIVYHEVRSVGGTAQYALASTAMSGSLGVVLRPSLLVVGIAALNRQVTTAQLFYWGGWVFALTSTMFFLASQLHRHNRHVSSTMASPMKAIPQMVAALKPVVPFMLLIGAIIVFYSQALDTPFNELSAPAILPVLMLVVLAFDRKMDERNNFASVGSAVVKPQPLPVSPSAPAAASSAESVYASQRVPGAFNAIREATTETVEHVGAYICLMLFTQIVSGMIERSEVMNLAPQHFPNVWLAMGFLVVAKVILGMVMEPLGAIMLVSSTLAPMAYANGIGPVNFWMMVLVAFELGYLLPPVALNQLLTRQVVGEAEIDKADAEVAGLGFYRRYERWILPCLVMAISLLIVAFAPIVVERFEVLHPVMNLFSPPI